MAASMMMDSPSKLVSCPAKFACPVLSIGPLISTTLGTPATVVRVAVPTGLPLKSAPTEFDRLVVTPVLPINSPSGNSPPLTRKTLVPSSAAISTARDVKVSCSVISRLSVFELNELMASSEKPPLPSAVDSKGF